MIKNIVICPVCHHGNFYGDDCKFCAGLVKDESEPIVVELVDAKPKPKWLEQKPFKPKYYQTLPQVYVTGAKNGHRRILASRLRDDYDLTAEQAMFLIETWENGITSIKDYPTENDELIVTLSSALNHLYEHYGTHRPTEGV